MTNEIKIIKEFVEVYPGWFEIVTGIIVPLGSLLGVIVTVWIGNRNNKDNLKVQQESFGQAIKRSQKEFTLSKLDKAVDIATNYVMDKEYIKNADDNELRETMISFKRIIYQYGSNETIEFFANLNQYSFEVDIKGNHAGGSFKMIAYYAYLISFLRFDISGEWIEPITLFKIISKDYGVSPGVYNEAVKYVYEENNKLIDNTKNS